MSMTDLAITINILETIFLNNLNFIFSNLSEAISIGEQLLAAMLQYKESLLILK